MDERFSANDIWPPYRPQCEGKWALAGKGQRNFLKPDVQTNLKADGTIQYKGDKVIAFLHRKMHKAHADASTVLVHVALVQWEIQGKVKCRKGLNHLPGFHFHGLLILQQKCRERVEPSIKVPFSLYVPAKLKWNQTAKYKSKKLSPINKLVQQCL